MKLEIGGGKHKRGPDWTNIDREPTADILHDLTVYPWPLADDSVDEVCSSHCLEHLPYITPALREIARVCKIGAPVLLRLPHPFTQLAMVEDHKHVFSSAFAENIDREFAADYWPGPKRLKLLRWEAKSHTLDEARRELPFLRGIPDHVVFKWIPGTAFEIGYYYTVAANDVKPPPRAENPWVNW